MSKVISTVGKVLLSPIGTLLGAFKKKKAEPAPEAPRVMPMADDEKVKAAQKADILRQRQRSGRESTILGGATSEKLGG